MPSLAVSATGDVVVAGATASSDFPVSLSATAATQGFVAKIASTNASEVVLVPASLSFGTHVVGVKSGALTLTLRNMGSKTLSITNVVAGGDFRPVEHMRDECCRRRQLRDHRDLYAHSPRRPHRHGHDHRRCSERAHQRRQSFGHGH